MLNIGSLCAVVLTHSRSDRVEIADYVVGYQAADAREHSEWPQLELRTQGSDRRGSSPRHRRKSECWLQIRQTTPLYCGAVGTRTPRPQLREADKLRDRSNTVHHRCRQIAVQQLPSHILHSAYPPGNKAQGEAQAYYGNLICRTLKEELRMSRARCGETVSGWWPNRFVTCLLVVPIRRTTTFSATRKHDEASPFSSLQSLEPRACRLT